MADLPIPNRYTVEPNVEVRRLWVDQQIAEKEMRVKRLEADAEEIMRAQISRIKADIIMLKREVAKLYELKDDLQEYGSNEIIDMKQLENK